MTVASMGLFPRSAKPEPNRGYLVSLTDEGDSGHGRHTLNSSQDLSKLSELVTKRYSA